MKLTQRFQVSWFNEELARLRIVRNNAQMRAEFTDCAIDWIQYRRARKIYNNECNKRKNSNIMNTVQRYKSDNKKLWNALKKKFMNSRQSINDEINFSGDIVKGNSAIANNFNEYFISSTEEINISIQSIQYESLNNVNNVQLNEFKLVDIELINETMKKMKKILALMMLQLK